MTANEYIRCKNDIVYFIEHYCAIKKGNKILPFHLTSVNKEYLKHLKSKL